MRKVPQVLMNPTGTILSYGAVVALTFALMLLQTRFVYEYSPVQSLRVFTNLTAAGSLYYLWLLLIATLLWIRKDVGQPGLILLTVGFYLVFSGSWVLKTYGSFFWGDGIVNVAMVKGLADTASLAPLRESFRGFDYPALHLLGSFVLRVTGLPFEATASVLLLWGILTLGWISYTFFRGVLGQPYLAALSATIMLQGNWALTNFEVFMGRYFGIVVGVSLLVALLHLQSGHRRRTRGELSTLLLVILLISSLVSFHLVSAVMLLGCVIGGFALGVFERRHKLCREIPPNFFLVVVFASILVPWMVYFGRDTTSLILSGAKSAIEGVSYGRFLARLGLIASSNFQHTIPAWITATRLSWLGILYALAPLSLLLWRHRENQSSWEGQLFIRGSFFGLLTVSLLVMLLSPGGEEFHRFFMFSPFLTVPALVYVASQRSLLPVLVAVSVLTSFPAFLAHHPMVVIQRYYPEDIRSAKFAGDLSRSGGFVFYSGDFNTLLSYFEPSARFADVRQVYATEWGGGWAQIDRLYDAFAHPSGRGIFVYSRRLVIPLQHVWGISPDDIRWKQLTQKLDTYDRVYTTGLTHMFMSRARPPSE